MSGGYSDDDSYGDYSDGGYSDDDSYGDGGNTPEGSDDEPDAVGPEDSDDEPEGPEDSDDEPEGPEDSDDEPDAVGNYGSTYSGSGGNQVSVKQQTYRVKNENKQSGSYERFTAKDKAVSGEPFVDRSGNRGYKDEHTTTTTLKVGDKGGYTEYSREDKVKHVDFGKSSCSDNKAVGSYSKYNKY